MTSKVLPARTSKTSPPGVPRVVRMPVNAHLVVQGAAQAAAFYRDAFGATELARIPTPDGRLMSLQLRLSGSVLHLADEFPELGVLAPPTIGGTPVVLAI